MFKRFFLTALSISLVFGLSPNASWGRGFGGGGFHGGGGLGGGFHGGGLGGGLGGGGLGGFHGGGFGGGLGGGGFSGNHALGGGGLGGGGEFGHGPGGLGGGGLSHGPGGLGGGALGDGLGGRGPGGRGPGGRGLGEGGLGGRGLGEGGLGRNGAGGLGGGPLSRDSFGDRFSGSGPSRNQLNSFLGLPSDHGLNNLSSTNVNSFNRNTTINANISPNARANVSSGSRPDAFDVNRGSVEGPRGGYAAGATVTGPRGNTVGRGAAVGPHGGAVAGRGFEGADGAAGVQGAAVGPRGRAAAGGAVRGPDGGVAARGAVVGPRGAAAGFVRVSPSGRYTCAAAVRGNFNHWGIYGPGWYTGHPGAWFAAGWAAGAAWRAATWNSVGAWMDYYPVQPVYYDYGTNVTYQDGDVYVNNQDVGTPDQYYQQAEDLATAGAQADAPPDGDWLPLGVFALTKPDHTSSDVTIQLAVNKQGVIRGNYTDTETNATQVIQGSVDKKTQRVAFTVGNNSENVVDTGLYNLTKDEAPCLLHLGKDKTEQWLLVRLKQPDGGK